MKVPGCDEKGGVYPSCQQQSRDIGLVSVAAYFALIRPQGLGGMRLGGHVPQWAFVV
jgi:hypothetical protein